MRSLTRLSGTLLLIAVPLFLFRTLQSHSISVRGLSTQGRLLDQHAVIHYPESQKEAVVAVAAAIATVPFVVHEMIDPSTDGASIQNDVDPVAGSPPPVRAPPLVTQATSNKPAEPAALPRWLRPEASALTFNEAARVQLAPIQPAGTTLHFTFGSSVMMDFVKNWQARTGSPPSASLVPAHPFQHCSHRYSDPNAGRQPHCCCICHFAWVAAATAVTALVPARCPTFTLCRLHFVRRAELTPLLVGAADASLFAFCSQQVLQLRAALVAAGVAVTSCSRCCSY